MFRRSLHRRPLFSIAITLLLTVAAAFSSIGFSAWYAAGKQLSAVSSGYTSIAIPYNAELPGFMPALSETSLQSALDLDELLAEAPVEASLDRRVVLGAYIEGTTSLTTDVYGYERLNYDVEQDEPYNIAVLAVRCKSVSSDVSEQYWERYDSEGRLTSSGTQQQYTYNCVFTVEEVLCRLERSFDLPEEIILTTTISNEDAAAIFQAGQTYLLRGRCYEGGSFFLDNGAVDSGLVEAASGELLYASPEEGILPLYAQYTGALADFLSGDGRIWAEQVIPAVEQNYSAAKLMLTDSVDSMYWFNTGEASILEGRSILGEEYDAGAEVCLVSLQYAQYNSLSVGDQLSMELYHPSIGSSRTVAMDAEGNFVASQEGDSTFLKVDPCYPENALNIEKTYTIVGIYSAPTASRGTFAFGADTIFAPKQSVIEAAEFEMAGNSIPLLTSIIIENGTSEEFESYLDTLGLGGSFLYFDQGYRNVDLSLQVVYGNALRLLAVSALLFFIALLACCFLLSHQQGAIMDHARRLGISSRQCSREAITATLPLLLCGLFLGSLAGGLLFQLVSGAVLSEKIAYSMSAAALCALVQLAVLLAGTAFSMRWRSRRSLMRRDDKAVKR